MLKVAVCESQPVQAEALCSTQRSTGAPRVTSASSKRRNGRNWSFAPSGGTLR
jgi:hypothetical protein